MAGGAAGEDRVQTVCSEKNRWFICRIYDRFNRRDAADFLAVTLYGSIVYYLYLFECRIKQQDGLYMVEQDMDDRPNLVSLDLVSWLCFSREHISAF